MSELLSCTYDKNVVIVKREKSSLKIGCLQETNVVECKLTKKDSTQECSQRQCYFDGHIQYVQNQQKGICQFSIEQLELSGAISCFLSV